MVKDIAEHDNKAVVTPKRGVKDGTLRVFQKAEAPLARVLSVRNPGCDSEAGKLGTPECVMFASTQASEVNRHFPLKTT